MSKFIIRNKINSLLKSNAKAPIVELEFLGTGGAFDVEEKNSSMLLKMGAGNVLIDCGSTVYAELRQKNLIEDIKYIFITHCHEDHIGSLSTLIYHKFFVLKEQVLIECEPALEEKLTAYLIDICGHSEESFKINSNNGDVYQDLNMRIFKIDTTNHHYKDYATAGFVFSFRKSGEDVYIIYSGDINTPITEIIEGKMPVLYEKLLNKPENVFILHEATAREYPPHYPHCDFLKLIKTAEVFPNIYTYHHSKEETKTIIAQYQDNKRKLEYVVARIENELEEKLARIQDVEAHEKLRIEARNVKEMFKEEFGNIESSAVVYDVNQTGSILVIQEKLGIGNIK